MNLQDTLVRDILPRVQKPSRYLGNELNAVLAKPGAEVRLALTFPDLYDLGLGNLGLHILYAILNRLDWCWAERVYAPDLDLEKELRTRGLPLFAIESKDSLDQMDGIGFTLQSELTFTNILNIIDLAGLPLRTKDRRESDPLTFAGGPAVFNPEPLAPFMDFFVIGDGEHAVVEIAEVLRRVKGRAARLEALAALEGVYVPALYPMETLPDGRVLPPVGARKIRKRITPKLDGSTFPVNYIVPFTQQVHDRISLEVLRGCTQGCRFCQAGMTTRPVRERTLTEVDELMARTLEATGYEEVSLVSLSTCDYSQPRKLVENAVRRAEPDRVSVSLPSLRLDSFSVELADMVGGVRRTGLTFAPEAASPRLRAVINKWIPDEELLEMGTEAYKRGWDHVKLYFMIGLPTERDDDVLAIGDLTLRTLAVGRQHNRSATVNTGVSTFVPKPFTPFQWAAQITPEETERRQGLLSDIFRKNRGVKFGRHHAEETFLEGIVSRADRRAGDVIERAFRLGARFDAWNEHRDLAVWLQAIQEVGFDAHHELRERALDERLPWDHIDVLIDKQWLQEDWQRATELKHAEDCRHSKCHRCGVIDHERALCAHMLRTSIDGRKSEQTWTKPADLGWKAPVPGQAPVRNTPEPLPVQRLVLRIGLVGEARYLSHLEAMNAWLRALRRAKAPLSYSQGFHAHAKVAFSCAHPVGEETTADYMDVSLKGRVDPVAFLARLQSVMPAGMKAYTCEEVALNAGSLMSTVSEVDYSLLAMGDPEAIAARIAALHLSPEIVVDRRSKKKGGERSIDLKPYLRDLAVTDGPEGKVAIRFHVRVADGLTAKPKEILALLGIENALVRKDRTAFV